MLFSGFSSPLMFLSMPVLLHVAACIVTDEPFDELKMNFDRYVQYSAVSCETMTFIFAQSLN